MSPSALNSVRIFLFILVAAGLHANPLLIASSGTFSQITPTSNFTAPGENWTMSFLVDNSPATSNVMNNCCFDAAFSGFSYTLNGSPVAVNVANIRFFTEPFLGLFNVCFDACANLDYPADGLSFQGPQVFSGLVQSLPQILPGTYVSVELMTALVAASEYDQAPSTVTISTASQDVSAPEPSTVILLCAGAMLIFFRDRLIQQVRTTRRAAPGWL